MKPMTYEEQVEFESRLQAFNELLDRMEEKLKKELEELDKSL